jgi:hypothetical protein
MKQNAAIQIAHRDLSRLVAERSVPKSKQKHSPSRQQQQQQPLRSSQLAPSSQSVSMSKRPSRSKLMVSPEPPEPHLVFDVKVPAAPSSPSSPPMIRAPSTQTRRGANSTNMREIAHRGKRSMSSEEGEYEKDEPSRRRHKQEASPSTTRARAANPRPRSRPKRGYWLEDNEPPVRQPPRCQVNARRR